MYNYFVQIIKPAIFNNEQNSFVAAGTDIYGLWVLAGDLGYVIVFPQFLMAVHWPQYVNTVGSIAGATIGIGKYFFDFIRFL